jgi:signal transduction histidine kinase
VDGEFPPIKVIIADGNDNEDVVIKVSDEGGGIPRSNMKKIWSYLFTTADPSIQEDMVGENQGDHSTDSPLAGLGYGLPISRSYCRYFGGDLSIMSMEGKLAGHTAGTQSKTCMVESLDFELTMFWHAFHRIRHRCLRVPCQVGKHKGTVANLKYALL